MKVIHEPNLGTIMMVEKAILKAKNYPTKTELWRALPKQVQYQTFQRVLEYLEASGKIMFNDRSIIYTGVNNTKLRMLLKTAVPLD